MVFMAVCAREVSAAPAIPAIKALRVDFTSSDDTPAGRKTVAYC
jgi:hypothetical protein